MLSGIRQHRRRALARQMIASRREKQPMKNSSNYRSIKNRNETLRAILLRNKQKVGVAAMSMKELQPLRSTYSLEVSQKQSPRAAADCFEVKASPSLGDINLGDIVEQARTYERCGAAMISV